MNDRMLHLYAFPFLDWRRELSRGRGGECQAEAPDADLPHNLNSTFPSVVIQGQLPIIIVRLAGIQHRWAEQSHNHHQPNAGNITLSRSVQPSRTRTPPPLRNEPKPTTMG